jgi:hypothetical protein
VWPRVVDAIGDQQQEVSREVANTLRISLTNRLSGVPLDADQVRFNEIDLDINNTVVFNSEDDVLSGIETGTDGTAIYGFITEITTDGISVVSGENVVYSGVPIVEGDRIVMTQVETPSAIMAMFLTGDGFTDAFEAGINDALSSRNIRPTAITLITGAMIIQTAPVG